MDLQSDEELIATAAERAADSGRFLKAIRAIDAENAEDPNGVESDGGQVPRELHFSRLLFSKTLSVFPEASEALMIAARGQHIARWKIERSAYPEGRAGYLKWRSDLKRYHADANARILESAGYDRDTIDAVVAINLKKGLRDNPDAQAMEDALCLVFLESQFAAFRLKTSEEKMVSILRKTWAKMSDRGRQAALALPLGEEETRLVELALQSD